MLPSVFFQTILIGWFPNHVNVVCWQLYLSKGFKVTKHFMPCVFTKNSLEEISEDAQAQRAVGQTELATNETRTSQQ